MKRHKIFEIIKKSTNVKNGIELMLLRTLLAINGSYGSCLTNKYAEGYPEDVTMVVVSMLMNQNN